ncbi:hypothetical protein JOF53_001678 [Crossiella equi]|uniref:Uncharacterized protein n=1 Tax=Crossiella equi TaxID=130796 RepID=A0ABS5A908_9PSEU|nr:hypothetical protein [Crossiella equi]MBP2472806.1 hypothetical protein [Crossiella equi]
MAGLESLRGPSGIDSTTALRGRAAVAGGARQSGDEADNHHPWHSSAADFHLGQPFPWAHQANAQDYGSPEEAVRSGLAPNSSITERK